MASSSFRPPPCTCNTYDVFISFRGEDTHTRFTDHLYKALKDKSIRVFRDDSDPQKRKEDMGRAGEGNQNIKDCSYRVFQKLC